MLASPDPLLGVANFDGPTIQTSNIDNSGDMYNEIRDWIARSTAAGNPWVVILTEASGGRGYEWYLKSENQGHVLDLAVENLRDLDPF